MEEKISLAGGSIGPSTDRHNDPVIDPTKNVLDLVESAILRQDNLREFSERHLHDIINLRAEIARLRDSHSKELREAEAKRIDAIRAVDVGAVASAANVQATQATTLAAQVATSAETLRNQVAAAATAQTVALAAALEPIIKDIADLRRAQYEAQGQKTQVVEHQASGASSGMWIGIAIASIFGIISTVSAVVAIILASGP